MPKRFVVAASDFSEVSYSPAAFRLAEALTSAATELNAADDPDATLRTAVKLARAIVPGTDHATVSVIERGAGARTTAWTDDLVRTAETAGPGSLHGAHWDGLWDAPVASIEDSSEHEESGSSLSDLGLRSVLSLRLRADQRRLSALTLYARKPRAFDETGVRIGQLLTAHISIALETATVHEQLTEAMRTRDVIGQATGLLMGRLDIEASEAFNRLVRTSQQENVKLRAIAQRIVDAANPN